ncbi:MAG: 50S ribosomal protein L4 [Candidatus Hydrogenedentota bacterium]
MLTAERFTKDGELTGKEELSSEIYQGKIYEFLLHQVITAYLANQRKGTVKTKTRAEVRGGGRKPWRQKGTGRARHSSIRSPLWLGGGTVFGPKPRNWRQKINIRMKRLALLGASRIKAKEQAFHIIENFEFEKPQTKKMVLLLEKMGLRDKVLIIEQNNDEKIIKSGRNIPGVAIMRYSDVNAYNILDTEDILFTNDSFLEFNQRLKSFLSLEKRG